MRFACWITKATNTYRIYNISCFSTTKKRTLRLLSSFRLLSLLSCVLFVYFVLSSFVFCFSSLIICFSLYFSFFCSLIPLSSFLALYLSVCFTSCFFSFARNLTVVHCSCMSCLLLHPSGQVSVCL